MSEEEKKGEVAVPAYESYKKTLGSYEIKVKNQEETIEFLQKEIAERDERLLKKDGVIKEKDYVIKEKDKSIEAEETRRKEAENRILTGSRFGPRSANESKEQKFEREYKDASNRLISPINSRK